MLLLLAARARSQDTLPVIQEPDILPMVMSGTFNWESLPTLPGNCLAVLHPTPLPSYSSRCDGRLASWGLLSPQKTVINLDSPFTELMRPDYVVVVPLF